MCRHLAYLGPPRSLSSLLYAPEHSLEVQSRTPRFQRDGATNPHGWGVGWWDRSVQSEPTLYRTASPISVDRSFRAEADRTSATAIMAAVRNATPSLPIVDTGNAPFAHGPWLFSLNGFVTEFRADPGDHLRRVVSPRRSEGLDGDHDSKVLFALVLDRIDAGAKPAEALAHVTANVLAVTDGKLNLLLSDGDEITATACGNSLFVLEGSGLAEAGVLVASEPLDDDPGWARVPDGSVVRASLGGQTIEPLGEETPRDHHAPRRALHHRGAPRTR